MYIPARLMLCRFDITSRTLKVKDPAFEDLNVVSWSEIVL